MSGIKLAQLSALQPGTRQLFSQQPLPEGAAAQERLLFSLWPQQHNAWTTALENISGFETQELFLNLPEIQTSWLQERGIAPRQTPEDLVIQRLQAFAPDVLLVRDVSVFAQAALIQHIRAQVPGIKLVIYWKGVPGQFGDWHQAADAIFSCVPTWVRQSEEQGMPAFLIPHAFDRRLLEVVPMTEPRTIPLSFAGSLYAEAGLHLGRQKMLEALVRKVPITVYANPSNYGLAYHVRGLTKAFLRRVDRVVPLPGLPISVRQGRYSPLSRQLAKACKPPLHGLDFYRMLAQSRTAWNIHIDSAGPHAANVRQFEVTGMQTCLLTDAKPDLGQYWQEGQECVAYASVEDCVEKALYLHNNPQEAAAIAARGYARCLRDHTFENRAPLIADAINILLKKGSPLSHAS